MTVFAPGRSIESAELALLARRAPIPAWVVVIAFGMVVALAIMGGKANLVRLGYPVGALAVGAWLYWRGPAPYIEFAWWLWHVSPGVRRIVDYQTGGYDPQNPMSLTPFLVSGLAAIGVLHRLPELKRQQFIPWAVAVVCILYGFLVGVLKVGVMPATHSLITWLVPLLFGLFCAVEWRRYSDIQPAIRRAFLWGSAVLAVYGIAQFIDPQPWDRIWMTSSGMYSVGRAFPYEVRVFSLVNAPLPFATILVAGLFIGLSGKGLLRVASLVVGTLALLLSLVRSAWLAGAIGLVIYVAALPLRSTRRLIASALATLAMVCTVPLWAPADLTGPTVRIVTERLLTFSHLKQDVSYKDRASFLDQVGEVVMDEPLGHGLGSTGMSSTLSAAGDGIRDFDNGIFAVLYSLGWIGGVALLVAALVIVGFSFRRREPGGDSIAKAARAVAALSLLLALGANVFEGVSAAVFWGFAGVITAAHQWYDDLGSPREEYG